MSRSMIHAGRLIALLLMLAWIGDRARAQGPTIEEGTLVGPRSEAPLLGSPPGANESTLGRSPGAGGMVFGQDNQGPVSGRVGPSVPRAPSGISTPGEPRIGPVPSEGIQLPAPLQVQPPPIYGTLDFPTLAEPLGPPEGLTLDQAIEQLVRYNLQLRSQAFELPQADADILTASLRANPILFADAQLVPYGTYSPARPGGPVQYDVNISYPFDLTHKRQARTLVARRAKNVLEAQYQDAVRLQIDNLYIAYINTLAARQAVRYAGAGVEGLDLVLQPLESQLRAGKITPAEYNRVKLQRETAQMALLDAEEAHRRNRRELTTLLNIPSERSDQVELRGSLVDEGPPPPEIGQLIQIARVSRPDLIAYRLGVGRARADVRLAKANRLNDVYVLYQPYTFQDNSPFGLKSATSWALGVTVPLPVYNRNQGGIRRAELNVSQTQLEMENLDRRIVTEVHQAEREYHVSLASVRRVENELQPSATQVLNTIRRQYEEGSIDVISYITARAEYNQVVKQYLDTLIRHRRSMLSLNTAVGRRILP